MAVALSLTLMLRTFPAAVVMALMRSKLIIGGKLEIITRLLWPPVLVILTLVIGVGTLDPNVGMLLKLLLAACLGAAGGGTCCLELSTVEICVKDGAGV